MDYEIDWAKLAITNLYACLTVPELLLKCLGRPILLRTLKLALRCISDDTNLFLVPALAVLLLDRRQPLGLPTTRLTM